MGLAYRDHWYVMEIVKVAAVVVMVLPYMWCVVALK